MIMSFTRQKIVFCHCVRIRKPNVWIVDWVLIMTKESIIGSFWQILKAKLKKMHAFNAPSKMKLINYFNVYYAFVLWLENNHKTQIFHKHCMHIWHTVNVC